MIRIRVLKIKSSIIEIAGICPRIPVGKRRSIRICRNNGEDILPELFPMPYEDKTDGEGNITATGQGFRAKLPAYPGTAYRFVLDKYDSQGNVKSSVQELRFGGHSMLQNIGNSFVEAGDCIVKCINNEIRIYKASWTMRLACRYRLEKTLKSEGKGYLIPVRRQAVSKHGTGKPVVIISDRVNRAGDNGEALFRYLMEKGYNEDYDIYFAVIKESPDYERMSKYGNVLDFGSDEYKKKFLEADKIISAGFDRWFSNAFDTDYKYMADLYSFDHYFLQHGVIMNDMSASLNYTLRGFSLFCTTTPPEYESILYGNYGYHDDEVVLTGLARYDLLEDEAEKLIVIAPTWRKGLAGEIDKQHGSRYYSDLIPGSEYQAFYNGLINNEKLIRVMKEHEYRGEFYLHPSFIENIRDFTGNETIEVCTDADYNRIFRKAAILITDYSSVNIDFAYLGKPVVYTQFDRESFFDGTHWEKGYFDYEKDGFGPVCTEIGETVDTITDLILNGAQQDKEYSERASRFFHYRDHNNCERIAAAIFGER